MGGGGARGAAHIGVLKTLHSENIKFDLISGTSAGSVIGAMYASTKDPSWIENRFKKFVKSKPFSRLLVKKISKNQKLGSVINQLIKKASQGYMFINGFNRTAILKKKRLREALSFLIPCNNFQDLKIPLKVVSTDLNSGLDIINHSGNLIDAVLQSCSIPGFIEPTMKGQYVISDGGVSMPIPIEAITDECDFTLAVDISNYVVKPMKKINILEILKRSEMITSLRLKRELSKKANFTIRPDTLGLHWSNFEKFDELIKSGEITTLKHLDSLKELIS